jgi:hypothetical protein
MGFERVLDVIRRIFPLPFWRIPLKMKELVYFSPYDVVM